MVKTSITKLRNYFSDRFEEIKDGTYLPSYKQIKELTEFSDINRSTFRVARRGWYRQNFHMSFYTFSSRLKNIRESDLIEKEYSKRGGVVLIILGVIVIVLVIWIGLVLEPISGQGWDVIGWVFGIPFGIILMVIGITLVLYNNYKLSKLEAQKLN
ncbi:MAG: hypothetical protein ACW98D_13340 [Promethearchaeota archaeon]